MIKHLYLIISMDTDDQMIGINIPDRSTMELGEAAAEILMLLRRSRHSDCLASSPLTPLIEAIYRGYGDFKYLEVEHEDGSTRRRWDAMRSNHA